MGEWAERMLSELTPQELVGQVVLSGVGGRCDGCCGLPKRAKSGR